MKILVVPSWYPPMGGRFFKIQAEALARLGHQVDVLILHEKGITQKVNTKINAEKSNLINEISNTYYRIPKLNFLNKILFVRKFKKMLVSFIKNNKPDVIHVHSSIWAGVVVSDVAQKYNIPYVITEHYSHFLEKEFPLPYTDKVQFIYAFKNSFKIICVSTALKNAIINLKNKSKKIVVIPNIVDSNFFNNIPTIRKNKDFTFISVGELSPLKGFDILLKAFSKIKNKKCKLVIVGQGNGLHILKAQAIKLNIQNNVEFVGFKSKENLLEEYNKAHVCISSSRIETFGVTLIEALSCGLPIIATNSGGPLDIVTKGNGYLAENENANSLHEKMELMLENYDNFDAKLIRENAIKLFNEKTIALQIEKILMESINKSK